MTTDEISERVKHHTGQILSAAGSSLRHLKGHYGTTRVLENAMDFWEEAYRAGAERGAQIARQAIAEQAKPLSPATPQLRKQGGESGRVYGADAASEVLP